MGSLTRKAIIVIIHQVLMMFIGVFLGISLLIVKFRFLNSLFISNIDMRRGREPNSV